MFEDDCTNRMTVVCRSSSLLESCFVHTDFHGELFDSAPGISGWTARQGNVPVRGGGRRWLPCFGWTGSRTESIRDTVIQDRTLCGKVVESWSGSWIRTGQAAIRRPAYDPIRHDVVRYGSKTVERPGFLRFRTVLYRRTMSNAMGISSTDSSGADGMTSECRPERTVRYDGLACHTV